MIWGPHYFYSFGNRSPWDFPDIFSILLFIGFVVLIFSLFRKSSSDNETDEENTALEILKKRYAKGEISKRQFQEMKKDIG